MNVILFSLYYGKLQLKVRLGIHQTAHPMDLKWRWNYWNDRYRSRRVSIL